MPINRRPPGWLDNGDPDYKGTTVAERRQMQNTWDLLEQQEVANNLAVKQLEIDERKIESEKQNADNIARATIEAEEIRRQGLIETELMRQSHEELMRKMKLCDDLNIDYKDIIKFNDYLNTSNNSIETKINDIQTSISSCQNSIQYINRIENTRKDPTIELDIKINNIKAEITSSKYNIFKMFRVNQLKKELSKLIEQRKIISHQFSKQTKKANKENNAKKENYYKEIQSLKQELDKVLEERKQVIVSKWNDFVTFRLNHYNEDIEMLFNKLELPFFKLDKSEVVKEGSIKDYTKYMETKISE